MKTLVMEHFNSILFRKSGPANKQHTYHSSLTSDYEGAVLYFTKVWLSV